MNSPHASPAHVDSARPVASAGEITVSNVCKSYGAGLFAKDVSRIARLPLSVIS